MNMTQFTKKIFNFFLCLFLCVSSFPGTAMAAADWPDNVSVEADGAILIDADTGTILWGKNIHNQYFPASITKVMTALLVIENCQLDDTVTFSHDAVFNVESGSSNAGINEGDQLSVKDCLYALLLRSANESANALAEHVAGSREAFADMMNAKAKELGCTNTHFANPSGLNNPDHYTSPYDMALIAKTAFQNPVFEEIDSTTYYKLPPNSINKEGLAISPGHKMMKKSTPFYYPDIVGGKTGYTTLAGNTLVTCAERNGLKLITVILKGSTPQYWADTRNLMEFGFNNFTSLKAAEYEKTYSSITNDLNFSGLSITRPEALVLDPDSRIVLPKTADFYDAKPELSYDISKGDPENAIARINYRYKDRVVGSTFLEINHSLVESAVKSKLADAPGNGEEASLEAVDASADRAAQAYREKALRPFEIPLIVWLILGSVGFVFVAGGLASFFIYKKHRDEQESLIRREQRLKRLKESGVSADEFDSLLQQRRGIYTSRKKGWKKNKFKFR